MLFQSIGQFNDGTTAWTCNQDEWSPMLLDMGANAPSLMNSGELYLYLQVGSVTSDSDTYQFLLGQSDTNDATNLNGTITYPLTTQTWTASGSFLQKTDGRGGLIFYSIPPNMTLRYWQLYCEFTTGGGAADLTVHAGLVLFSALRKPTEVISQNSGITSP